MKQIDWHRQGYIPQLLYFQNGASYTGSVSNEENPEFRYKIAPKDGAICAEVWEGTLCYEKSEIMDHSEFGMDAEGRSEMIDWLQRKYETMAGR
jgi:hypothetical protein